MVLKWINQRNIPIIHFPGCKTRAVGIYFLLSSVILGWKINDGIWFMFFPVVPHWRTEGALWEPGGDRRHSHAAGFPAPAFDGDTPPGGETEVQHRAGKQELAYTRSTCQAQLHRLARRSDLNVYHCLLNWRQKQKRCCWLDKPSCQPFSGEEFEGVLYVYIIWKAPLSIHIAPCSTGAIFGALQDILGSRSVSRDYYNQTGRIPDWCCLSSPPPESLYEAGKTPPPLMKRAFSTEK